MANATKTKKTWFVAKSGDAECGHLAWVVQEIESGDLVDEFDDRADAIEQAKILNAEKEEEIATEEEQERMDREQEEAEELKDAITDALRDLDLADLRKMAKKMGLTL